MLRPNTIPQIPLPKAWSPKPGLEGTKIARRTTVQNVMTRSKGIRMSAFRLLLITFCFLPGLKVQPCRAEAKADDRPEAPAPLVAEDPTLRGLDSNLYMQTSAEYRACCYQAYNLATLKMRLACAETGNAKSGTKPPAIVMDLDETVLDNGGFQAMMLRSGIAYDQRLWDIWEEKHSAHLALVPGTKEFLLEAAKLGVQVFHVSNRNDKFRVQAKQALERLGVPVNRDEDLKLATTTSDKTARRQEIEKKYSVVLYVGDNLRDFDEKFRCPGLDKGTDEELEAAIKSRKDRVDADRAAWGEKWIILPNPAYGEWAKPLGRGKRDLDRLAPTTAN